MKNHETAEKLLSEARYLRDEVSRAHEQQYWNLAVRRAQEVVELSLKALLKALGREYPRLHDVGDSFAQAAADRQIDIDRATLERIQNISSYLARDRAPAFYLEQEFTQAQAGQAQTDARFVLTFAEDLAKRFEQDSEQESSTPRSNASPSPGAPPE